jgi:hypothetical protein
MMEEEDYSPFTPWYFDLTEWEQAFVCIHIDCVVVQPETHFAEPKTQSDVTHNRRWVFTIWWFAVQ